MESSLENKKTELANKYLGKAGIHGIGIDNAKKILKIYYNPEPPNSNIYIFKKIKEEAHPFSIEIIASNPSSLF